MQHRHVFQNQGILNTPQTSQLAYEFITLSRHSAGARAGPGGQSPEKRSFDDTSHALKSSNCSARSNRSIEMILAVKTAAVMTPIPGIVSR